MDKVELAFQRLTENSFPVTAAKVLKGFYVIETLTDELLVLEDLYDMQFRYTAFVFPFKSKWCPTLEEVMAWVISKMAEVSDECPAGR
jgi:hypothetical protein